MKTTAPDRATAPGPFLPPTGRGVACIGIALALSVAGCSDDDENDVMNGEQRQPVCTVAEQNTWIQSTMQEWYLENTQLPSLNPAEYETPDEFLDALVEDVDLAPNSDIVGRDRFSVVLEFQEEQDRLANIFSGFGLLMQVEGTGDDRVFRLLDVFGTFDGEAESPASRAGLARGDTIESFDGESVATVFNVDRLEGLKFIFGFDVGEEHELGILKRDGQRQTVTLVADELTPTSVPLFKVFTVGAEEVGYVFFRDFDFASVEGLRQAIGFMAERGVTKVIIDQRYNLGGFVFVVDYFANLLLGNDLGEGPNRTAAVIRAESWNTDKTSFDRPAFFAAPSCPGFLADSESLRQYDCQGPVVGLEGLTELVFINSNNTASASEVILNSMRSHVDVTVVGARSVGKPVGSAPFPGTSTGDEQFCGLVLRPTTFRNVNADDEGDYFDGFVPDCPVADDPTQPIGDEAEASIAVALGTIGGSTCAPSLGNGLTAEAPRRRILLDAEHTWSYANSLARLRDQGRLFR